MSKYYNNIFINKIAPIQLCLFLLACSLTSTGQQYFGKEHLELVRSIHLKNITGKVTGMAVDLNRQVIYVAGANYTSVDVDNNSMEIVDLNTGELLQNIENITDPQHICYIPQNEEIFVSTSGARCYFYSTKDFKKTNTIKLTASINTVYYDSADKKIYAGYGDDELGIIGTDSHKQTGFMLLPGLVEDIQLDKSISRLYANMPEINKMAIIDLKQFTPLKSWPGDDLLTSKMTIDTIEHRVFMYYKKKSELFVTNEISGKKILLPITLKDVENLYYDYQSHAVYIKSKDGVNIFSENGDGFKQIANIQFAMGMTVSLFIPELHLFVMNKEGEHKRNTELLLYKIVN